MADDVRHRAIILPMVKTAEDVIREVCDLPEDERARAILKLVELFGMPEAPSDGDRAAREEAFAAELQRRIDRLDSGEDKPIPWEDVRAEALARVKATRKSA